MSLRLFQSILYVKSDGSTGVARLCLTKIVTEIIEKRAGIFIALNNTQRVYNKSQFAQSPFQKTPSVSLGDYKTL